MIPERSLVPPSLCSPRMKTSEKRPWPPPVGRKAPTETRVTVRPPRGGPSRLPFGNVTVMASLVTAVVLAACQPESEEAPGPSYQIEVTHLGRIGSADDPELIHHVVVASFLSDGRIALIDGGDPGRVKFFSRRGEFLGAFGSRGQGPREFVRPYDVLLDPSGDTLLVLDHEQRRVTRWSPDGSEWYDTELLPGLGGGDLLLLDDGRFVVNAPYIGPDGSPLPAQIMTRDREAVRGLGRPFRTDLRFELRAQIRRLTMGTDGTIWMAPLWDYRLERWDTAGVLVEELHGAHLDMSGADGEPTITPRSSDQPPPSPFIRALEYDPEVDLLWVFISVPRDDWRDRVAARGSDPFIDVMDFVTDRALRQTRMDLWDPAVGRLVGSRLVDGDWRGIRRGPGMASSYDISPEGLPVLDLWQATATPSPTPP